MGQQRSCDQSYELAVACVVGRESTVPLTNECIMLYVSTNNPKNVPLLQWLGSHPVPGYPMISAADTSDLKVDIYNKDSYALWERLQKSLPVDCRCLVYGRVALIAPKSGVILAIAIGTFYLLQVPEGVAKLVSQTDKMRRYIEALRSRATLIPHSAYQ
jgi:hypothetical protein